MYDNATTATTPSHESMPVDASRCKMGRFPIAAAHGNVYRSVISALATATFYIGKIPQND